MMDFDHILDIASQNQGGGTVSVSEIAKMSSMLDTQTNNLFYLPGKKI